MATLTQTFIGPRTLESNYQKPGFLLSSNVWTSTLQFPASSLVTLNPIRFPVGSILASKWGLASRNAVFV